MLRTLGKGTALGLLVPAALLGGVGPGGRRFQVRRGLRSPLQRQGPHRLGLQANAKESLAGKTETADKRFQVKDGIIVANEKDEQGQGRHQGPLHDQDLQQGLHLKLEFRAALKADSGVYIRGPQLQVRDFIRRGEQKQLKKFKNDDWNELEITVNGGRSTRPRSTARRSAPRTPWS